MTPQQLFGTAIRLFAIWLVITAIPYFSSIPATELAVATEKGAAIAYVLGGAYFLVALLLWFFPMFVANKLLPRTWHTNNLSVKSGELARVGCALLGLWLFSQALPSLVWLILRSFLVVDVIGSSFLALSAESKLEIALSFFELAFAVLVIIKAGAFARLVSPESEV